MGFPLCLPFCLKFLQPFFLLNHKVMLNLFKEPFRSCWDNVTSVPKNIHVLYYIYRFGSGVPPLHFWNELTWSWYVIFSRYSWLHLISNENVYICMFTCVCFLGVYIRTCVRMPVQARMPSYESPLEDISVCPWVCVQSSSPLMFLCSLGHGGDGALPLLG